MNIILLLYCFNVNEDFRELTLIFCELVVTLLTSRSPPCNLAAAGSRVEKPCCHPELCCEATNVPSRPAPWSNVATVQKRTTPPHSSIVAGDDRDCCHLPSLAMKRRHVAVWSLSFAISPGSPQVTAVKPIIAGGGPSLLIAEAWS